MVKYFLYNYIPSTHPGWVVAMLVTGRRDADYAMRCHWGSGCKFISKIDELGYFIQKVKADCGDVSDAAQDYLAEEERQRMIVDIEAGGISAGPCGV